MDKRENNKGTLGNKGGRPSKAEEVQMIERLTPLEPKAFKALEKGAEEGGEIVAEGGGPEDVITDAVGLAVGIGTTIYGLIKKPHTPLEPPPATESSVSYQAGI